MSSFNVLLCFLLLGCYWRQCTTGIKTSSPDVSFLSYDIQYYRRYITPNVSQDGTKSIYDTNTFFNFWIWNSLILTYGMLKTFCFQTAPIFKLLYFFRVLASKTMSVIKLIYSNKYLMSPQNFLKWRTNRKTFNGFIILSKAYSRNDRDFIVIFSCL